MTRLDKSISLAKANVFTVGLALPLLIIAVVPYVYFWGEASLINGADQFFGNLLMYLVIFIGGIVIHELLHGLTWQFLTGEWGSVEYGVKWRMLTPYAHLKKGIRTGAYRVGVWMPGLVVGILPLIFGLLIGNGAVFWFGVIFTWAAGGDAMILWLLRDVPNDAIVEDHPERAGCYVYIAETS